MYNKDIYLIFSKTGTLLSKAIGIFSESKYVHASISFDNNFTKMYSFGRINPDNPFSGGFVEENLYDGVYKRFSRSECVIYKIRVTEEQYFCLRKEVNKFLQEKNKYRYNFFGLFGVLLNMSIKRNYYYFCSQFISEILIKSGVYNTGKIPELVKADDLLSIKDKEKIYEGYVNEYHKFDGVYSYNYYFTQRENASA